MRFKQYTNRVAISVNDFEKKNKHKIYINYPFDRHINLLMLSLKVCVHWVNLVKPCLKALFLQILIFFSHFLRLNLQQFIFIAQMRLIVTIRL